MEEGFSAPSKIDLAYAEHKIVFAISHCCTDKKYSFHKLTREQAELLVRRLQHFEKLTWKQLSGMGREEGLTVEDPDGEVFRLIDGQNTSETKLLERHYFHMRIEKKGAFRIFGFQSQNYFYITHIDPNHTLQKA